jgi:hypothetical protein
MTASQTPPRETPEDLQEEVREIRENMTGIVGELDRRGHAVLDWRLQLKSHAVPLVIAAAGLLLVVAGSMALSATRNRRRQRPLEKARRLRQALSRIIAHPELVARPSPNVAYKVMGAAASAVAGSLAKTLAEQLGRSTARAARSTASSG